MTIKEALTLGEQRLASGKLPIDDAAILLAHALEKNTAHIFAHPEANLAEHDYAAYISLIARRSVGHSVAVLKGRKEFYGLSFKVTPDVLIPRPETELLVDEAARRLRSTDHETVLDMGTGSGCIIIALALRNNDKKHLFFASDISEKALAIAAENARDHQASIHFFRSNLFDQAKHHSYSLIIANLPYLTTTQLQEPSIKREPIGALWGGTDGLDLYRAFMEQAPEYVTEHFCILLEIDPTQNKKMLALTTQAFPDAHTTILEDLSGLPRVLCITG